MGKRNTSVEIRNNAVVPPTFADTVRLMKPTQYVIIEERHRTARYNQATVALPGAKFTTRKISKGIVHLIRVA